MKTIIIDAKNHKKEIKRTKKPVLLSFAGTYGISAFLLKQTADSLSDELQDEIKIGIVEMNSQNAALARKYNVRFLPTTLLIQHGKVTDRIIGNMSKDDLIRVLETSQSRIP
ncbi:MAG: thioredoxin [Oscillospiraceae bacterium]|jgi:thioredoxin-like negative regulator of GroEL|nr:thioredoxin [Oscillospiraceae bacterium]